MKSKEYLDVCQILFTLVLVLCTFNSIYWKHLSVNARHNWGGIHCTPGYDSRRAIYRTFLHFTALLLKKKSKIQLVANGDYSSGLVSEENGVPWLVILNLGIGAPFGSWEITEMTPGELCHGCCKQSSNHLNLRS